MNASSGRALAVRRALHFERPGGPLRRVVELALVVLALAAWTWVLVSVLIGEGLTRSSLAALVALPALLVLLIWLSPSGFSPLRGAALAWCILGLGAAFAAPLLADNPVLAAGPPAIALSTFLAARYPAAAVVALFAISGTFGSIKAFTGVSPALIGDVLLAGLWISVVGGRLIGAGRERAAQVVWLPVLALVAYVFLSAFGALSAEDPFIGLQAFRASAWYLAGALVILLANWDREVYRRILQGAVLVCILVCGYAVLRWQIGPAGVEEELALQTSGPFNFVDGELRTFGSTAGGHQLGFWAAIAAPLCLAFAATERGWMRWASAAGLLLAIVALLASEVRGAFVGAVIGALVVIVLLSACNGLPRPRLPLIATLIAGVVVAGGATFALTIGQDGTTDRYTELLNPTDAQAYDDRQVKWAEAFREIEDSPFGAGLGTGGRTQQEFGVFVNIASRSLDNSYIKIAYEQGLVVMAFFVLTLAFLAFALARASIDARSREGAGAAIAGVGVLTAFVVAMYTGLYIEDVISLVAWLPLAAAAGWALSQTAEAPVSESPQSLAAVPSGGAAA